jgi:hypothetical protein
MNKRSRIRNKERNKYARLYNAVMRGSRGCDPLGIPNVNFSCLDGYTQDDIEKLAKYKQQRVERGFDNTELWNLYYTFALFILPRLVEFRKLTKAYPPDFETFEEWVEIIDKMIYAFDHIANEESYQDEYEKEIGLTWDGAYELKKLPNTEYSEIVQGKKYDEEKVNKLREWQKVEGEKIDEGLMLFGKYFRALWW